ncbi:uncharacterized protein TA15160 [Theileria annulata]|uniref:VHS domain-containing protein n=1 Tax=Theileria annulata TaxID=5874 RepID=Q4UFC7_THEAN|nr:uncharacterized protein TA15160 [Theileria annulata]CAI74189.1 hypothetical protein, conserved [Theileria annulata]|eukprot:XP_951921.1 hypothetical protein, conserved [Theileria annulata]
MGMDENTHKRLISRNISNTNQQHYSNTNQHYCTNSNSSENFQDTNRKKNINLKQIKNITTNCAKSITNKLITFSNSLTQNNNYSNNKYINSQSNPYSVTNPYYNQSTTQGYSHSTHQSTSYGTSQSSQRVGSPMGSGPGYGVNTIPGSGYGHGYGTVPGYGSGNGVEYVYGNNKPNTVYSINNIINRIVNNEDIIRTHRELVIIIEYCLSYKDFLVEINIEKDRFGAPTMESINNFSIINHKICDKILDYIRNRKDCCIFVVKFITWKMRCTKKPEEVILSLELLFNCLHKFGGYFLILFTKSLMKTLRKLLFITNFKSSITSNVKKKITKILGIHNGACSSSSNITTYLAPKGVPLTPKGSI